MKMDVDVAVVGAGAAGAVAASVLAKQGARVLLLEEGPNHGTEFFNGDIPKIVRTLYRNGGALVAFGMPPIVIQVGRGVGGSTVINGGTCFRTPQNVLESWSEVMEGAFAPEDLTPFFERVEADIHISEVPPELAFEGERRLLAAAHARGDEGGFVKRNAWACQGTGLCPLGCPTGAKQSVEQNYVPWAQKHGATLMANTRVDEIRVHRGQVSGLMARQLDGDSIEVRTDKVVLCAGAIHTPLLLKKSLGWHAPRAVGRHLYLHPGAHIAGFLADELPERTGPIQSIYVDSANKDYVIFGMGYPPEVLAPILGDGSIALAKMRDFRKSVTLAVMASDHGSGGRVRRGPGGDPIISYRLRPEECRGLVDGMAHAAELLFDIGATEVFHSIRGMAPLATAEEARALKGRRVSASSLLLGSVHPMGTCRMGLDPTRSVVDPNHRVHGVRGLWVPDASFFPTPIGVNPQVTIMAFAMRCAEMIT